MDNAIRKDILARAKATGYPGNIVEAFRAYDQGRDLVQEYVQQQQEASQPQMQVARTPEEQEQGLRPAHAAGNVDQTMAFPNVQPGQSFNTMGMKANVNIEKFNDQGNLVESYKNVPPGIVNLPTGPYEGTVIESPARMKTGGAEKDPPTKKKIYTDPLKFAKAEEIYNDSLSDYLKNKNIYESYSGAVYKQTYDEIAELAEKNKRDYGWDKSDYPQKPQVKPVYKEKPKDIPTKTPKLEIKRDPIQLFIPESNRILDNYNNTLEVLRAKQREDKSDKNLYPTTVVPKPPDFKTGGINKYQTAGVETPPANLPWIGDKGQVLSKDQQDDKQFGLGPRIGKTSQASNVIKASDFKDTVQGDNELITIKDPRKIRLTTGKELDPNRDLMSKSYPASTLRDIIFTAKARGLSKDEALTLAAMDLQETQWGITDNQVGHVMTEDVSKPPVERFIDAYLKSKETADRLKLQDEYTRLQVYNGLGTITPDTEKSYHGFRMKKIYGVPVPESGINMRENPLYGKQIVDLRDNVLKKNPEFLELVDSYYLKKTGGIDTTQEAAMYEWRSGLPEDSRKRYFIGGLKNRVLYNKAKYKR